MNGFNQNSAVADTGLTRSLPHKKDDWPAALHTSRTRYSAPAVSAIGLVATSAAAEPGVKL
ncbi:hypothetical protein WMF26_01710 [Sorangium sp. So ce185]|uniref:hypothetical protein n=1 Tax=Sorangium sp. So ce185 TaxID=3133287 RepID=UPI003F5EC727